VDATGGTARRHHPEQPFRELAAGGRGGQFWFSGDLYEGTFLDPADPTAPPIPIEAADPKGGVPVFPIGNYRSYLRGLCATLGDGGRLRLVYEQYHYEAQDSSWSYGGSFAAELERGPAPRFSLSEDNAWVGLARDLAGTAMALITINWLSPFLRRASLEIENEAGSELPLDNGLGLDWAGVFRQFGWDLRVDGVPSEVPARGSAWPGDALHQAMLDFRNFSDLDAMWNFHLLSVNLIEHSAETGGFMYDRGNFDANGVPREGAAIATDFHFPADPKLGPVSGQRQGDVPAVFFRAAVHEIGHALGLVHNTNSPGFMAPTLSVANQSTPGSPFPENILWDFDPADRRRLQHFPDVVVRPGGAPKEDESLSPYAQIPPLPRTAP
jgi:hypothetical protein